MFHLIRRCLFITLLLPSLISAYAQPAISSFSPEFGKIGDTITISGTNFNSIPANNVIYFGSVRSSVISGNSTSLKVIVPTGVTYQPITVTANGLTAYSAKPFILIFGGAITINSFAQRTEFAAGSYPTLIVYGDLNDDGKPELVASHFNSNKIYVYKNAGSAGIVAFAIVDSFATATKPEGISFGDLNGDGKPDITVTSIDDHLFSVFVNTSSGGAISFSPRADFNTGLNRWPRSVAISDLDGDGKPDVITPDNNLTFSGGNQYGTVSIHPNTSFGGTLSFGTPVVLNADDYARRVFISDLDGDNKPDIVVGNNNTSSISIFKNNSTPGNISFSAGTDYSVGSHPEDICIGDLDGDNKADVVVANFDGASSISIFKNTSSPGTISFSPKQDIFVLTPIGIEMSDLDGNGKPDLAVAGFNSNAVSVFRNISVTGTISFAPKIDYIAGTGGSGAIDVTTGDVDGDGIPDLSVTNGINNKILVLRILNEPALSRFTPVSAGTGMSVSIKGINLNGASAISFGGTAASSFNVESSTTINAVVGSGSTGNISITTPTGTRTLGGFSFNVVTAVNNLSAFASDFEIYPGPINDIFYIRYNGQYLPKPFNCQLIDITGKVLDTWQITTTREQKNLQKIPSGIYILRFFESGTKKFFTRKIIKL